jgi:hypothetical protein
MTTGMIFSANNKYLITTTLDGLILFWRISSDVK